MPLTGGCMTMGLAPGMEIGAIICPKGGGA